MNDIKLIGLSGQLQNGKDTVAELMLKHTPDDLLNNWQIRRFADILKKMTALIIGCDVLDLEFDSFKNTPLGEEWRRFYIYLSPLYEKYKGESGRIGKFYLTYDDANNNIPFNLIGKVEIINEILTPRLILQILGTECGRDLIHENIWVNATLGKINYNDNIIITDCRFPNEVYGIKKRNGILVRVVRPSKISTSTHPSETSLNDFKDWDYTIINDGNLEDLKHEVKKMLIYFNISIFEPLK